MDIYEAIKTRKSVRSYREAPVEEDKLLRVLEAARLAPSASNRQEWRFVVVSSRETIRRLAQEASGKTFIAEAPVLITCCAETDGHIMRGGLPCHPIDVAIAIDHLTLAAAAEGLGTCWIGAFDPVVVHRILGIPESIVIVSLLCLGYPRDSSPLGKNRLPLASLVHRERW